MIPTELEDLGPSGVVRILALGNLWSGRGEYASHQEAVEAAIARNSKIREDMAQAAEDAGREIAVMSRSKVLDLPQVSVSKQIIA